MAVQLLKLSDVTAATRLGRSTIYRRIGKGTFPAPLRLSSGCVRWDAEDLQAWRQSLGKPANDNAATKAA